MPARWLLMISLLATTLPAEASMQPCRVIAVGARLDLRAAETEATFRAEVERWMSLVDAHRATDRPNLVLFPEDIGLPLALLGERGTAARSAATTQQAFAALAAAYQPALASRLPVVCAETGLPPEAAAPRALLLALTDSMTRAFLDAFDGAARRHQVYLVACLNAGRVRDLNGPPPYEPDGTGVYNIAVLFGPDGRVIGRVEKVHLVPLEEQALRLCPGPPDQRTVFELPFGRVGIAVCWDAFHEDTVGALAAQGAELVLQPSANPGLWAAGDPWQAEDWLRSVLVTIHRPPIRYHACAMLTGPLFDLAFDGQSIITARGDVVPDRLYVGVDPSGYRGRVLALSDWLASDSPGPLPERRARLHAAAVAAARGERPFVESVIWADLP